MISDSEMGNPINSADFLIGSALNQMMQDVPLAACECGLGRELCRIDFSRGRVGAFHAYHCGFGQNFTKAGDRHGIVAVYHRQENPIAAIRCSTGVILQKIGFAGC